MKGLLHIKEGKRLSRFGGRRVFEIIATQVDIKELHVGGSIQSNVSRTKFPYRNQLVKMFNKKICHNEMTHSL